MSRTLIVNADDYGLTVPVSEGILRAHREGVVTSTSVLALGPAFARTVDWLGDAPELGTGAHLALVGEDPPLLSAAEIPTLVDRRGRLRNSWRQLLPLVAAGRVDRDDVRRELDAQLTCIEGEVAHVDHLDSHQNVHLWPAIREVVIELGEAHGVRAMRVTRSRGSGVVGATVGRLARGLESALTSRGWSFPAASSGLDDAGRLDRGAMVAALDRLSATGASSAELATHPGQDPDPDRVRYRWGYRWPVELEALCSATVRTAVEEAGFTLGTFGDLGPVVR